MTHTTCLSPDELKIAVIDFYYKSTGGNCQRVEPDQVQFEKHDPHPLQNFYSLSASGAGQPKSTAQYTATIYLRES